MLHGPSFRQSLKKSKFFPLGFDLLTSPGLPGLNKVLEDLHRLEQDGQVGPERLVIILIPFLQTHTDLEPLDLDHRLRQLGDEQLSRVDVCEMEAAETQICLPQAEMKIEGR